MAKAGTSTAHTPGPWHVGRSQNNDVYKGQPHWCILPDPDSTHGQLIADIETLPEAEANAYLMAAAPAQNDALQAIANDCSAWLDGTMEISGEDLIAAILSAADAAIAEAQQPGGGVQLP